MDRRIRSNGLAHSPKQICAFAKIGQRMHDTLYMCIYSSGLEAFAARDPFPGAGNPGGHAAKAPSPLEYIHTYGASCIRWSILANAQIHCIECA